MKKIKILLVSLLTVILSLFCLASCGETGKWVAVKYAQKTIMGSTEYVDIPEDNQSYIEMNKDNTIVIFIEINGISINKNGVWAKGEEEGAYLLTFDGSTEELTIEDGVMTYDAGALGIIQFEKSK